MRRIDVLMVVDYLRLTIQNPLVWTFGLVAGFCWAAGRIDNMVDLPTAVVPLVLMASVGGVEKQVWWQSWMAAGVAGTRLLWARCFAAVLWTAVLTGIFVLAAPQPGRNLVEVSATGGVTFGAGFPVSGWFLAASFGLLCLASQWWVVTWERRVVATGSGGLALGGAGALLPWVVYVGLCVWLPSLLCAGLGLAVTGTAVWAVQQGLVPWTTRRRPTAKSQNCYQTSELAQGEARRSLVIVLALVAVLTPGFVAAMNWIANVEERVWGAVVFAGAGVGVMVATMPFFERGARSWVAAGHSMTTLANRVLWRSVVAGLLAGTGACIALGCVGWTVPSLGLVMVMALASSVAYAHFSALVLGRSGRKDLDSASNMGVAVVVGPLQLVGVVPWFVASFTADYRLYTSALLTVLAVVSVLVFRRVFRHSLGR